MVNWYLQSGKESDIVVSSRIRLARNISEFPFTTKYKNKDALKVIDKIEEILPSMGYGLKLLKMKDLDDVTIMSLIEKHIISPDFALNKNKNNGFCIS